jgi:hypothetical protein
MFRRAQVIGGFAVVTVLAYAAVGLCSGKPREKTPSLGELAQAYAKAASAEERRDICIRAIDLKYIAFAKPVKNVARLCGKDFRM